MVLIKLLLDIGVIGSVQTHQGFKSFILNFNLNYRWDDRQCLGHIKGYSFMCILACLCELCKTKAFFACE